MFEISLYEMVRDVYPMRIAYPQNGAVALQFFDYTIQEIFDSADKQEEIARLMDEKFDFGFTYTFDYGTIFVESLGIPLLKPDFDFHSTLENPIKSTEKLKDLKKLNPYSDGNMPVYLESVRRVKEISGKPQFCSLVGPLTLAAELCGVVDLARMTIKNKDFVKALVSYCKETVIEFAIELQKAGVDVLQISEPTAVILSPKLFRDIVQPALKELTGSIEIPTVLHICGNTSAIIDTMLDCGFDGISVDQIMDIEELAQNVPDDIVLVGNIDPLEVMANMTPDQVRSETVKMLKKMDGHINYIPSFGCDLAMDMPIENLEAFLEEVNNYWR